MHIILRSAGGGGGGLLLKWGGGGRFSGLNTKPDNDGQPFLTIPYTSQGFQTIILDWMRWITLESDELSYIEIFK